MSEVEKVVDEAMSQGKLIIGKDKTVKLLKLGKISKVVLASNTPKHMVDEINYTASISGAEVIIYDGDNKDLGALCRKPFLVSVVGILKE